MNCKHQSIAGQIINSLVLWIELKCQPVVTVEAYALAGTKCHLPSTVKYLGEGALSNGWYDTEFMKTKTIYLPESLEVIGDNCIYFERYCGIIKIPASVKKIGERAFGFTYDCYTKGFEVNKKNKYFKNDKNNWLYSKDGKRLIYALSYNGDIIIPEGVEYCGADSIHNSPTSDTFADKTFFPATLKKLHQDAFFSNSAYFTGEAPDIVNSENNVGRQFFYSLFVPKGKKQEYIDKFQVLDGDVERVKEFNYQNGFFIVDKEVCAYNGNGGHIVLPKGITRIVDGVFSGNDSITEVIIPDSVTSIGQNTFNSCVNLSSITLPANLKKIEIGSFSNCVELKEVILPEKLSEISAYSFNDCNNLERIYIPESVIEISAFAFEGCTKLMTITGKSGSYAETYAINNDYNFTSE